MDASSGRGSVSAGPEGVRAGADVARDAALNAALSAALSAVVAQALADAGGWLPFDRFMAIALYEPGLGYYHRGAALLGRWPDSGSDFVTAPELSGLFGATLAEPVAQALAAAEADTVVEFGAGSGALAEQLLQALGPRVRRYAIVELSGALRQHQQARLAAHGERVQWLDRWPEALHGVVIGNEVLDAMPVKLLHFDGAQWHERGVVQGPEGLAFGDRPTALRPPNLGLAAADGGGTFVPGTVTEIHPQAEAFVRELALRLVRGAAFFIDYGFPEAEYYHPQRVAGTLMAHQAHRALADAQAVLQALGQRDITAHVNFSAIALAAQDAGLAVLGYTSQARFLFNAGIARALAQASLPERALAARLVNEHEMGELFKVLMLGRGLALDGAPLGFVQGDRLHRL